MEEVLSRPPAEKPDLIAEAKATAERIEKANVELNALLTRKEQLMVQEKLGGRGDHVKEAQQKSQKEIENEEAHNILMKALK